MNELGIYYDTIIKANEDGYYSLTDMWKANGGTQRNKPVHWLKTGPTKNLLKT